MQNDQDYLDNEVDNLIQIHRFTNVPMSEIFEMPAVRYDVYVERLLEMKRKEDLNASVHQKGLKFNG